MSRFTVDHQLIAYHEVGHVIMFYLLGVEFSSVTLNITGCDCCVTPSPDGRATWKSNGVSKVLCCLGGPAAEVAAAEILRDDFAHDSYCDEKIQTGWVSDVENIRDVVSSTNSHICSTVYWLSNLITKVVWAVGEELAPILLESARMVPSSEVLPLLSRHKDALTSIDIKQVSQSLTDQLINPGGWSG